MMLQQSIFVYIVDAVPSQEYSTGLDATVPRRHEAQARIDSSRSPVHKVDMDMSVD